MNDYINEDKINVWLLVSLIFVGWFGVDKFVAIKAKGWKLFIVKLLATFIGLGVLWNILDIVMCILKKYQPDPRYYLNLIEKK